MWIFVLTARFFVEFKDLCGILFHKVRNSGVLFYKQQVFLPRYLKQVKTPLNANIF